MKHFPRFLIALALVASTLAVGNLTLGGPVAADDEWDTFFYAAETTSCPNQSVTISTDDPDAMSIHNAYLNWGDSVAYEGGVLDSAGPFAEGETFEVTFELAPWMSEHFDSFWILVTTQGPLGDFEEINFDFPDPCPPTPEGCIIDGQEVDTRIPDIECDALVTLYRSTNGAGWTNQGGWNTPTDPCGWQGVTCSATNVTQVHQNNNKLVGPLPAEIGNLTNLQALLLPYNRLSELPTEIRNLTNLQTLWLQYNQLSELPTEIRNLTNLQTLHLEHNQLSELPTEIRNLTNLQTLSLHHNQLSELPTEIGNLTNLQTLWLHYNQLSELPTEIGKLNNLQTLTLSNNQLSELPTEIGNLNNLQTLGLQYNQLSELPTEIGNLNNLQTLSLDNNKLAGTVGSPKDISVQFAALTNLTTLALGDGSSGAEKWNNCLTVDTPELRQRLNDLDLGWDECQPLREINPNGPTKPLKGEVRRR